MLSLSLKCDVEELSPARVHCCECVWRVRAAPYQYMQMDRSGLWIQTSLSGETFLEQLFALYMQN